MKNIDSVVELLDTIMSVPFVSEQNKVYAGFLRSKLAPEKSFADEIHQMADDFRKGSGPFRR